jgi:sulfhydrogenase subunit delta
MAERLKKLGVWKFASCDGCQLTLLDCEDELLSIARHLDIAYFMEASSHQDPGPYDLGLVEGSVTTPHDAERIKEVRERCDFLVSIGACASSGGIQALRNFRDSDELCSYVYAHPEYIEALDTSTPISDHVKVDFELRGCPIDKSQLLEVVSAYLNGRRPRIGRESVCLECKRSGAVCVTVARGVPCMGPITQQGCGAICPGTARGCYGCFGPRRDANVGSIASWWRGRGVTSAEVVRSLRTFNANAPAFRAESERHD